MNESKKGEDQIYQIKYSIFGEMYILILNEEFCVVHMNRVTLLVTEKKNTNTINSIPDQNAQR